MTLSPLNFDDFQAVTKQDWLEGANAQLRVENAEEKLTWKLIDGFNLKPYYDQSDATGLEYLPRFFKQVDFDWELFKTIKIDTSNPSLSNSMALQALNEGCTGILFEMSEPSNINLETLTKGIQFEHCYVSFLTSSKSAEYVHEFIGENKVKGVVLSKGESELSSDATFGNIVDLLLIHEKNPYESISVSLSSNFFFELARIRAIRYLLHRVDEVLERKKTSLWVHAEIHSIDDNDKNLMVQTSAGLAAVIGGANSVSFSTNRNNGRIASNIGNLIREEAKMTKYNDASSGSYFIDSLTNQIIQSVWSDFQLKMS